MDEREQTVADLPPTGSATTDLTALTVTMASIAEVLKVAADAAAGYRRHMTDTGWNEAAAEFIAAQALAAWQHRWLAGHR